MIPLLQEKYHLLIPALPGYDFENDSDFTTIEQIASELNDWLSTGGYRNLYVERIISYAARASSSTCCGVL